MSAESSEPGTEDDPRLAHVRGLMRRSIALKQQLIANGIAMVPPMADACIESLARGGKLLLCGNGGSAADAQHLAAELLVRLRPDVNRQGVPAIALALDSSALTACGNDLGYEAHFERMALTLGAEGDVLIGISTSGNSPNVVRALQAARPAGMVTMGLLGNGGGEAAAHCDYALVVPSSETGRVQEAHITLGHALMEQIEDGLLHRGAINRTNEAAAMESPARPTG